MFFLVSFADLREIIAPCVFKVLGLFCRNHLIWVQEDTMKLTRTDTLEVKDRSLLVNGKQFTVTYPYEPLLGMEGGNVVTIVFRGCGCSLNEWEPEEIDGDFV